MPIYISRGRFTPEAVKGMLANPENREEAVAKLFQSLGGRLIGWYLTFGRHDWLAIGEFPDEKAAASAVLAAAAGGSLSDIETTVAMTAKRFGNHLRICRKGGTSLPERWSRIGSGNAESEAASHSSERTVGGTVRIKKSAARGAHMLDVNAPIFFEWPV